MAASASPVLLAAAGRLVRAGAVFAFLALVGLLLSPLEAPAWETVRSSRPEPAQGEVRGAHIPRVLPGFRSVAADLLWIRLYVAWERQDRDAVEALAEQVTRVDPRPSFFWINTARILAYDIPVWRVREEGGRRRVPDVRIDRINREQTEKALALLQRGLAYQPENPLLHIEMAQIHLHRRNDLAVAAEWFGRAAALPGAPSFAVRMHSELRRILAGAESRISPRR